MATQGVHAWHDLPDIGLLAPDSHTAQLLQHATPDHLHITSRRFFIGPIPESWLKTHRRDWYKHHLHINYSARTTSFSNDRRGSRDQHAPNDDGPSNSTFFQHSFPRPENLSTAEEDGEDAQASTIPVAQEGTSPALPIPRARSNSEDALGVNSDNEFVDANTEPENDLRVYTHLEDPEPAEDAALAMANTNAPTHIAQASGLHISVRQRVHGCQNKGNRVASATSINRISASINGVDTADAWSGKLLLHKADNDKGQEEPLATSSGNILGRLKRKANGQPSSGTNSASERLGNALTRQATNVRSLVHFDIPEDSKRAALQMRAKQAQMTIQQASTMLWKRKIKPGLIIKMERMLIRIDTVGTEVPADFDENVGQKVDTKVDQKWREYMVVCRHNPSEDADFVLQMYKTRVIPEIEEAKNSKRAAYDIALGSKTTRINLYSALDKSVVVWAPAPRGTRMFIMQARTAANAGEWYTFLRTILGWRRTSELQITVPDLSVNLHITNPFVNVEKSQYSAQDTTESDTEEAVLKSMREEQVVAESLIGKCLKQLEKSPEWMAVIDSWLGEQRIGLAWRRYDRLEWIHGANQRKMYATMAMSKSHELELRPKSHYPTITVTLKKKKMMMEPTPVEGFLIRLTSQRGRAKRLGLMYHKQLYFATQDQYLTFSRPTNTTPPPPPSLLASSHSNIPSARVIAQKTPDTWIIDPYPVAHGQVEWLADSAQSTGIVRLRDEDAADESRRKADNLLNCDGYINLTDVVKVRKAKMGAVPADEYIESGSDVDFDEDVNEGMANDGTTNEVDIERTFELLMKNGLIVRLQAADKTRRMEWIKHLRALVQYWKHRIASDVSLYKATRARNLDALNIDEEAEAYIGQFAQKWEVTKSFASPELYHMCGIAGCRSIHMSGMLYRKPRIHAPFTRCSVLLIPGKMLIFQDVLRSRTGKQVAHIHHERIANLDLKDCYVYSGLLTEPDLLYQNQTFDANAPGHHALPRIYFGDGTWTSTDEDVMTTFVVWHGKSKSWFRAEEGAGGAGEQTAKGGTRTRLKRVGKLGSKGRSVVFRARSRAERDHWVLAVQNEIERAAGKGSVDARVVHGS